MLLWLRLHWPEHVTQQTQGAGMCNLRWAQKQAELWVWVESIGLTESSMECLLCAKQWEET